ncbi:MAG: carbohydrate kinase family protein [Bacteroidetes bacterium]|nr:carbohydrate kinase family protein [Bacteroidota bacterium]
MSDKQIDVLVAGELNIDLIMDRLGAFPQLGKEIIASRMLITLGSSSAIFASNLSVLGTRVAFCGRVGRDNFAAKILADLAARGVDTRSIIQSDSADTGLTVALSVAEDRAMVTYPGAMDEFSAADITDDLLDSARHLHVSSAFLQPALKPGLISLFRRAKQRGLTTSLDPQWDPAEKWDLDLRQLLPLVDVFLPNAEELKRLAGKESLEESLSSLADIARIIVVKNGNEGALLQQGTTRLRQPAFLNRDVADAIGAGDSFNAGFLHLYVKGAPLAECMAHGALCGAINTTHNGGTTAFADYTLVKQLAWEKFNVAI